MEYTASLKKLRMSQRKAETVAKLVRKLKVSEAERILSVVPKRAAAHFLKLLHSAEANAKHNFGTGKDNLYIKEIKVGAGPSYKRWRPVARGSAHPILKRTSQIKLVLADHEKVKEAKNK